MDTVIRNIKNDGILTLTLPSNAEDGQMYKIIGGVNTRIVVNSDSNDKIKSQGIDFADSYEFSSDHTITLIYLTNEIKLNGTEFGVWHVS